MPFLTTQQLQEITGISQWKKVKDKDEEAFTTTLLYPSNLPKSENLQLWAHAFFDENLRDFVDFTLPPLVSDSNSLSIQLSIPNFEYPEETIKSQLNYFLQKKGAGQKPVPIVSISANAPIANSSPVLKLTLEEFIKFIEEELDDPISYETLVAPLILKAGNTFSSKSLAQIPKAEDPLTNQAYVPGEVRLNNWAFKLVEQLPEIKNSTSVLDMCTKILPFLLDPTSNKLFSNPIVNEIGDSTEGAKEEKNYVNRLAIALIEKSKIFILDQMELAIEEGIQYIQSESNIRKSKPHNLGSNSANLWNSQALPKLSSPATDKKFSSLIEFIDLHFLTIAKTYIEITKKEKVDVTILLSNNNEKRPKSEGVRRTQAYNYLLQSTKIPRLLVAYALLQDRSSWSNASFCEEIRIKFLEYCKCSSTGIKPILKSLQQELETQVSHLDVCAKIITTHVTKSDSLSQIETLIEQAIAPNLPVDKANLAPK